MTVSHRPHLRIRIHLASPPPRARRLVVAALVCVAVLGTPDAPRPAVAGEVAVARPPAGASPLDARGWVWPAAALRLERPFVAPAHDYAPGHRGIDIGLAATTEVRTPAAGVVAFSGQVAGRGILTIDHGDGLVTTLEPVDSALAVGDAVERAQPVGALAAGGHAAPGSLHFGVRLDGAYINPMLLLGGIPRAVLLPCC